MIKKESIFISLNAVSRPNLSGLKIWKCSALFYVIIFSFIYHLTTSVLVHNHQNHTKIKIKTLCVIVRDVCMRMWGCGLMQRTDEDTGIFFNFSPKTCFSLYQKFLVLTKVAGCEAPKIYFWPSPVLGLQAHTAMHALLFSGCWGFKLFLIFHSKHSYPPNHLFSTWKFPELRKDR